jgi:hypothetical protein
MHPDRFEAVSRSLTHPTSRRGVLRLLGVGVAGTAITAVGLNAQTRTAHALQGSPLTVPATGATDAGDLLEATFTLTRFDVQNGALVAIGNLVGTFLGEAINQVITLPVSTITGTCEILHLELGPLDLDLLGLVVHLDQIVLDITAESGSGNLLGNLLCAIAGLLDNNGSINRLVGLLNNLLRALGG